MASPAGVFWDQTIETMSREELEVLQAQRLRSCLERMRTSHIPFYRERLSEARPEEILSVDDLRRLPFTVKDDLREHYPFGLLLAPTEDVVRVHASSGSTGKPTVVAYTRADLELWADTLARGLVAGGVGPGDVFQNAAGYGLFTGGLGFHDAATRVGAAVVPTSSGNTARQVRLMRDFGATAFNGIPSYALHVAEVAADEGVDLRSLPIRAAFLGAEPMSEGMRAEIEERMGVAVYEQYGLSEVIGPGVASACGRSEGMHVWEDRFVPEVVDPDTGEPLPDGEVGELVLSAPSKEAFPVLRYRTRDRARLIREPCPCGRTSVRVSKILGRTDDMLIVHGVNVFPSQIEDAILGVEGVEPQYRIVLSTRADRQDDLRVQAESRDHLAPPARAALEARLHEVLGSTLGLNVAVELVAPYTIQRSEGKAVRVLDQRAKTP